jgi:hypothetical protein
MQLGMRATLLRECQQHPQKQFGHFSEYSPADGTTAADQRDLGTSPQGSSRPKVHQLQEWTEGGIVLLCGTSPRGEHAATPKSGRRFARSNARRKTVDEDTGHGPDSDRFFR